VPRAAQHETGLLRPSAPRRLPDAELDEALRAPLSTAAATALGRPAKQRLGLFEEADQQQTPSLKIACMSRIQSIPVHFERRPCLVEGLRRPAEIARYGTHLPESPSEMRKKPCRQTIRPSD
jgi:hypothetical protein